MMKICVAGHWLAGVSATRSALQLAEAKRTRSQCTAELLSVSVTHLKDTSLHVTSAEVQPDWAVSVNCCKYPNPTKHQSNSKTVIP